MVTLVIAEKPKAAEKIAYALGAPKKKGTPAYYEVGDIIVVPAVGHLFTLKSEGKWTYPVFDMKWVPSFEKKESAFTEAYYNNFAKMVKKAKNFVVATDYDNEGSVIGYNILVHIFGEQSLAKAKRMKFSTLTEKELKEAYANAGPLDNPQIEAGLARHILDWLWGINVSRALTLAVKSVRGGFTVLSTGRVQGPALKILAERERAIKAFVPTPFWQLEATLDHKLGELQIFYEEDKILDKKEAESIQNKCTGDAVVRSVEKKEFDQEAPHPFDLTSLQIESYAAFGFSPSDTLSLAQNLYEAGLISYPRTSSQKLPPTLGLDAIVAALAQQKDYKRFTDSLPRPLRPNEGLKADSAHPAIHPTGEKPKGLTTPQKRLYDLIVRRFLSSFARPATRESVKIVFDINGHAFHIDGTRTVKQNWIEIYAPYVRYKEVLLPVLKEGQKLSVKDVPLLEKETQPPKRYTEASIVRELERRELGTKATRSEIIRTLYDRSYVAERSIEVTDLGMRVVETLEKYAPEIISEEMTRRFEKEMEAIEEGKQTKEVTLEGAKNTLVKVLEQFKEKETKIGEELNIAVTESRKRAYEVGPCPKCGKQLRIIVSRASGKRFVGCTGYADGCRTAFPLPQSGLAKPTEETCEACKSPVVLIIRQAKRPWELCINPTCPAKAERGKKKETTSQ